MLEHRREVALKIVLKNENAYEIRIAHSAEDVPGESHDAECADGGGMRQPKSGPPQGGSKGPKCQCSSGE